MSHRSGISHTRSMAHRSSISGRNGLARSRGMGLGHKHTSSFGKRMGSGSMHAKSIRNMRNTTLRNRGISNSHAFVVGKTTGVNINGSHMGAIGASLHRTNKLHGYRKSNTINNYSKKFKRSINNKNYSNYKHRYTSKKVDFNNLKNRSFENFYTIRDENFDKFAKFASAFGVILFIVIVLIFFLMLFTIYSVATFR